MEQTALDCGQVRRACVCDFILSAVPGIIANVCAVVSVCFSVVMCVCVCVSDRRCE